MMAFRPFDEVGPSSIAAMERALLLEPDQSEALSVKALMTQLLDHDWEAAGRLYQRAVASSQTGHAGANYGLFYLQFVGQQHQAIELYSNLEKLDPLHAGYKANVASTFYFAGDDDGAIRKAREAFQLDPEHVLAIQFLIVAYTNINDTVALDALLAGIPSAIQELAEIKSVVARSYSVRGDEAKARKIYNDLLASFDTLTPMAMFDTAFLAISLGKVDESVALLEHLEKTGSWMKFWSKHLPLENSTVLENPRYQALLKRMGLDDESVKALNERMSFQ